MDQAWPSAGATVQTLQRLVFLQDIVAREVALLQDTDSRLFAEPMTTGRAASLAQDVLLAERVD